MSESVLCFGPAHFDKISQLKTKLVPNSSNPVKSHSTMGGVGFNITATLRALEVQAALVSAVGNDLTAENVLAELIQAKISTDYIVKLNAYSTGGYTAILSPEGELVMGLAEVAIYEAITAADLSSNLLAYQAWAHWILTANLSSTLIEYLLLNANSHVRCYASTVSVEKTKELKKIFSKKRWAGLFTNRLEAEVLLSQKIHSLNDALCAAKRLQKESCDQVFLTLAQQGVVIATKEKCLHLPALTAKVLNVNAAGDIFTAATLAALSKNHSPFLAAEQGLAAASIAVELASEKYKYISSERIQSRLLTYA